MSPFSKVEMSPLICYNVLKQGGHYAGRGENHNEHEGAKEIRGNTENNRGENETEGDCRYA